MGRVSPVYRADLTWDSNDLTNNMNLNPNAAMSAAVHQPQLFHNSSQKNIFAWLHNNNNNNQAQCYKQRRCSSYRPATSASPYNANSSSNTSNNQYDLFYDSSDSDFYYQDYFCSNQQTNNNVIFLNNFNAHNHNTSNNHPNFHMHNNNHFNLLTNNNNNNFIIDNSSPSVSENESQSDFSVNSSAGMNNASSRKKSRVRLIKYLKRFQKGGMGGGNDWNKYLYYNQILDYFNK